MKQVRRVFDKMKGEGEMKINSLKDQGIQQEHAQGII